MSTRARQWAQHLLKAEKLENEFVGGEVGHGTQDRDSEVRKVSRSHSSVMEGLGLGCTLVSPGKLSKAPTPRPPPQTMKSECLGSKDSPKVRPAALELWKPVIDFL